MKKTFYILLSLFILNSSSSYASKYESSESFKKFEYLCHHAKTQQQRDIYCLDAKKVQRSLEISGQFSQ